MWEVLFHDSSSSKLLVVKPKVQILEKGIGPLGHIHMLSDIWECYTPKRLESVRVMQFCEIWPVSKEACIMLKALVRQGVMYPCANTRLGPNRYLFQIPRSMEKASLICSLVLFNREPRESPARLELPSIEIVALIMLVEVGDT